ncbi:MAG: sigma-70 family RNA polymerase sigma factor [Syntrophomonadaceae bacterium]|nr:sigma-70 family RNA polymerase sigma factor [Syntrophomonadaceae bacterium]
MFKTLHTQDGDSIIIEITEEGKVTYVVGKRKTTFDLGECGSISYEFSSGEKTVITGDMLGGTEEIEPWLWPVISQGEDRLEYNNQQTETRRHHSYSNENDKRATLIADEDMMDQLLANLEEEAVREAIRSLKPRQQELVLDIFYRGLSMAEVARRDGVRKMAISNRMNKIIKRLRDNLKNF